MKVTKIGNYFVSLPQSYSISPMKIHFKDEALSELYETGKTKSRKYKQLCKNKKLVDGYIRAVGIMFDVDSTAELSMYSFLHYEKLKKNTLLSEVSKWIS